MPNMSNEEELSQAPVTTLNNGIRVANFCDANVIIFTDGNVLAACDHDRAVDLEPRHRVTAGVGKKNSLDLHTSYDANPIIQDEMRALDGRNDVDIVLVSIPVMEALREWGYDLAKSKARTKVIDKITKTVRIDQFGTGLRKVTEPESVDR